jgi:DNA-binding SARP family transcriptional activator
VLAEEHGVEPEPATTELYEQIRAGKTLEAPAAVKPIRGYELREQIGARGGDQGHQAGVRRPT